MKPVRVDQSDLTEETWDDPARGTLRGLHFQKAPYAETKLVRAVRGRIFDVAVDLRRSSPDFGRWFATELSADNHRQMWIPAGFAHGFVVLSEQATFHYLCTATYDPQADAAIRWDDADLAIDWPVSNPSLSGKDAAAPFLADIPADRLPPYGA